jgi:hypothetical protein
MAIKQQKPEGKVKGFLEGLFACINIFGIIYVIEAFESNDFLGAGIGIFVLLIVLGVSYKLGLLYDRSKPYQF